MLSALLASTALAHAGTERTFYLVDANEGLSDETPGDRPDGPTDGLTFEWSDETPFVARTPLLSSPLVISLSDSFHLHLADREAFVDDTYTTAVWIDVRDATDGGIRTEQGARWFLASALVRARSDASDGWSDFRLDAARDLPADALARGLRIEGDALVVPAGFRLVLAVALVSDQEGPGAVLRTQLRAVSDDVDRAGILPGRGDITCPTLPVRCSFLEQVDVKGTLVETLRHPPAGQNIDSLLGGLGGIPASTFRADDAGSWLRVTTAG